MQTSIRLISGDFLARVLAITASAAVCFVAGPRTLCAQSTLDRLRGGENAVIGIANDPPFMSMTPDGKPDGIGPSIDKAVLGQMGVSAVAAQVMEYGALIPAVRAHRIIFASGGALNITPERCQAVLFSEPTTCMGDAFVVRADPGQSVTTYKEVADRGLKIGVCGGCTMEKFALGAGVKRENLVIFPDDVSGLKMLLDKRIDVLASGAGPMTHVRATSSNPSLTALIQVKDAPMSCTGAVFSKEDAEFRNAYNAGLKKIQESGEYTAILKKFGNEELASLVTSRSTALLCQQ
ncbi:polar amino acid transport system substrate-binding protein [Bradyrhizobium sp. CIR48]|uniref:ectoine/hydroxyectoine ABC transporter substrate-binding protein EhuB n=1 Tax=Bradyrhizobium sp. CIR48 TaxID=2663840 RepID=UPI0016064E5B|nr:ectoine/hydroxyectoine ABC transporter substrate-binding protein EhuB [Bradyrhizobium sp. CIR48]MBB4423864.1 polar amino acid transport system substrate-binding protein [Bradyrhizobium sp. CIR48]